MIHFESQGGETVAETIRVDGTYDGDAEGSFGLIRRIVDSGSQENATGTLFEADKIENEFWFNVSATPIGPINEEWQAEHNLTYEFTVPQTDWGNRTIRYQYIEDNGTVNNEYPEVSPIITQAEAPEAEVMFENHISRETGAAPENVFVGDRFSLVGNDAMVLSIVVTAISDVELDGHMVEVAEWLGDYGENSQASGSIVNEGPLAGLLNEVYRWVEIDLSENGSIGEGFAFVEHQMVDRVLSPPVITADENTPPAMISIGFREGRLLTEGDSAHLEVVVDDFDTDVTEVTADLTQMGLGIVELSDSGLFGDYIIHDDIWTALIVYNGLEYGLMDVTVGMQDFWVYVEGEAALEVTNAAPRMMSLVFTPDSAPRGDPVEVRITAVDGHGIESIGIDLLSTGGELTPLTESDGVWTGQFTVPHGMAPGERIIPVRITDGEGESIMAEHVHRDGYPEDAPLMTIVNEAPWINSVSVLRDGEQVEAIHVPESGDTIAHTLEATIEDPDGVSSAQAKIGRLAPIGSSDKWLLMVDDGTGGDRLSGDGVYTIQFDVRSSLPEGNITIQIRATDTYQSMTPDSLQSHTLQLEKTDSVGGGGSWVSDNATTLVLVVLGMLMALGITAVAVSMRNSELE